MFIDHNPSLTPPPAPPPLPTLPPLPFWRNKKFLIASAAGLVVVLAGGLWWFLSMRSMPQVAQTPPPAVTPSGLPETLEPNGNDSKNSAGNNSNFKGETLTFGSFYKPLDEPLDIKIKGVSLPLNVKTDVSNYYEVARKINLDQAVAKLNKEGFAVIDSPFPQQNNDFYGTYAKLSESGVPALVTTDFLLYYYQNSLKRIYKDLEASYFYDSVWKVNKQLFDAAHVRYQERRQKLGISNDPLLEAERLEASYFAMSLGLLTPSAGQLNANEDLNDTSKFKPSEAKRYEFAPPSYLSEDLNKELALIREGKQTAKSPIFLYSRDYSSFRVPAEYATSAKLKNFYTALAWQTSLFPLNYKSADCPDCSLDKDDWTINQIAAYLIAEDMQSSQPLKNEWAKIYKVMGYFTGLRSDLTYLNYQQARFEEFAKKPVEEIFAKDAFSNLSALSKKLNELNFRAAEGGLDRTMAAERKNIGLRVLQTPFWPDQYLYSRLTFNAVGPHNQPKYDRATGLYLTACPNRKDSTLYRCKGIGYDIIAAVSNAKPASAFLQNNTNYQNYEAARSVLSKEISALNTDSWHATNFWTSLDIQRLLQGERLSVLPYTASSAWRERQMQFSLASMTLLSLPADQWELARTAGGTGLGGSSSGAVFDFIEPNQALLNELAANASMLFKALAELEVVKDNDSLFGNLTETLGRLREISRKELRRDALTTEDYLFLSDFMDQYKLTKPGVKTMTSNFFDPSDKQTRGVKKSVVPLKLLLLVYEKDGKKILALGPVFSYKEE